MVWTSIPGHHHIKRAIDTLLYKKGIRVRSVWKLQNGQNVTCQFNLSFSKIRPHLPFHLFQFCKYISSKLSQSVFLFAADRQQRNATLCLVHLFIWVSNKQTNRGGIWYNTQNLRSLLIKLWKFVKGQKYSPLNYHSPLSFSAWTRHSLYDSTKMLTSSDNRTRSPHHSLCLFQENDNSHEP